MGIQETKRSFLLNASMETLSVSRRAVDETLWYLGHQRVEIARIAVNELVGNAINHGHLDPTDDILLDISASSDRARIEVKQPTIIPDAPVREPGDARAGLGLRIVSSLTDRWGFEKGPPGVVWFEVGPA
jgi:anti-sigma regulatory factor (Ser/Thr protein kinase)